MLPDQLFYNTGIFTYIWSLRNEKPAGHRGRVMLIDAREQFEKEPKSFGNKRNRMTDRTGDGSKSVTARAGGPVVTTSTSSFSARRILPSIRSRWSSGKPTSTTGRPRSPSLTRRR